MDIEKLKEECARELQEAYAEKEREEEIKRQKQELLDKVRNTTQQIDQERREKCDTQAPINKETNIFIYDR